MKPIGLQTVSYAAAQKIEDDGSLVLVLMIRGLPPIINTCSKEDIKEIGDLIIERTLDANGMYSIEVENPYGTEQPQ